MGDLHILHITPEDRPRLDSTVVEVPTDEFWRAIRLDLFCHVSSLAAFGIPPATAINLWRADR